MVWKVERLRNLIKTMVWEVQGSETLSKQWSGRLRAQKHYKYNGLQGRRPRNIINTMVWKVERLRNLIKTMVWEVQGSETLSKQWSGRLRAQKH
jgi:hypothetical protein